jgi:hypothetical protein
MSSSNRRSGPCRPAFQYGVLFNGEIVPEHVAIIAVDDYVIVAESETLANQACPQRDTYRLSHGGRACVKSSRTGYTSPSPTTRDACRYARLIGTTAAFEVPR